MALLTVKLRLADGAALKVALPAWAAVMVQVPARTRVIVAPLVPVAVHTVVVADVNVTGVSAELAVALTVNDPGNVRLINAANVIV